MSEWLPIETAPKDGTQVLLYHRRYGTIRGAWRNTGDEYGECWAGTYMMPGLTEIQPTHWQPLPQPPP